MYRAIHQDWNPGGVGVVIQRSFFLSLHCKDSGGPAEVQILGHVLVDLFTFDLKESRFHRILTSPCACG